MLTGTRWGAVFALVIAGIIAALQIGKSAIALPVLQSELSLSLFAAAWIVGAYSVLGAVAGLPGGILVSVFDARRTMLFGLAIAGAASLAGAAANSGAVLIATRMIEGCGFLAVAIATPRLLRSLVAPRDSETVFALWAAYLPAGAATMMLAGPYLMPLGWEALWIANGAIALIYAAGLSRLSIDEPTPPAATATDVAANVRTALGSPGPLLLALAFGIYTFQYSALTGLLPTLLVQQLGLSISIAGLISALTVVANAVGNMCAGLLARIGMPLWAIAATAFLFLGAAGFGIFSQALPVVVIALLASASLALTGLIPGSIFGAAPKLAPTSAALAISLGLINQTSNIGNLLGPAALGAFVEAFGWARAPFVFVGVMIAGVTVALLLRHVLRRTGAA
jgi:MFS family permease